MGEDFEEGAPFFFATQRPPTAMAQDDDIFLTVTAAAPTFPSQVDIDIILSIEYAQHAIAQLRQAVDLALRSEAPRGRESPGDAGSVPQSLPGATAPVQPHTKSD